MVDPYIRPGAASIGSPPRNNQWLELASALQTINPSLQRFMKSEFDEQSQQALAEGEAQQKRDKLTFKDAVRKGVIPEGANPFLKLGYLKGDLRIKGQEYQSWLMEEWQKDGDIQNSSPDTIPDWMAGKTSMFAKERLQGIDARLIQEVFDPAAVSAQNRLLTHHVAESFRRTEEQSREVLQRELTNILEGKYTADPIAVSQALIEQGADISSFTSEDDMSQALIARSITDLLRENVSNGMSGSVANQIAIQQVAAIADMEGDLGLLGVLDNIQTNTGTLGGLSEANEVKLRVSDHIVTRKLREEQLYWQRKERREAEEGKQLLGVLFDTMSEAHKNDGLHTFDPLLFIKENNITSPEHKAAILQEAGRFVSAVDIDVITDDTHVSKLLVDMNLDPTFDPRRIHDGAGVFYDTDTEMRLWDDYRALASRKQQHPILDDPRFERIVRETGDAVKSAIGGGFGSEALNASDAQLDMEDAAASFLQKNPEATSSEFYEAMRDARDKIVGHYNEMATDTGLGRVEAPRDEPDIELDTEPLEPTAEQAIEPDIKPDIEPPPEAIQMLMQNPANQETIAQFDEVFGAGSAARVLSRQPFSPTSDIRAGEPTEGTNLLEEFASEVQRYEDAGLGLGDILAGRTPEEDRSFLQHFINETERYEAAGLDFFDVMAGKTPEDQRNFIEQFEDTDFIKELERYEDADLGLLDILSGQTPEERRSFLQRFIDETERYEAAGLNIFDVLAGKTPEDRRSFLQQFLDEFEREELPIDTPFVNPVVEG